MGNYRWLYKVDALSAADAVCLLQTKVALDEAATAACTEDFVRALKYIPLAIAAKVPAMSPRF